MQASVPNIPYHWYFLPPAPLRFSRFPWTQWWKKQIRNRPSIGCHRHVQEESRLSRIQLSLLEAQRPRLKSAFVRQSRSLRRNLPRDTFFSCSPAGILQGVEQTVLGVQSPPDQRLGQRYRVHEALGRLLSHHPASNEGIMWGKSFQLCPIERWLFQETSEGTSRWRATWPCFWNRSIIPTSHRINPALEPLVFWPTTFWEALQRGPCATRGSSSTLEYFHDWFAHFFEIWSV